MSSRLNVALLIALMAGLAAIYAPTLTHPPVFDDSLLVDPSFAAYSGWPGARVRTLSYGTFAWLGALTDALWLQRAFNVLLHATTCLVLFRLHRLLAEHTQWPAAPDGRPPAPALPVAIGVAVFAFNPVAVYAVAYLIQRSILMAALFSALALWLTARAVLQRRPLDLGLAVASYLAAVASKEHAVLLPAAAVALVVFLRRPPARLVVAGAVAAAVPLLAAALALRLLYPDLVGAAFDELSRQFVAQLEQQAQGIGEHMWPLSALNQSALFFVYGLLWLVPNVQWMAIDLRPAFPLSLLAWPQLLGPLAYTALAIAASAAVLRSRGPLGYAGLCVLLPIVLFGTEFATVWVQDPLVLYRSYLWALGLPGLVAIATMGLPQRVLLALGVVVSLLLGALAVERALTFKSEFALWNDAAEKIDLQAPVSAVGRWRPFLNRGAYYLENNLPEPALRDFRRAAELAEPQGAARFNAGVALLLLKRPAEALAAIDAAIAQGFDAPTRPLHRGDALAALGRLPEAIAEYGAAIDRATDAASRQAARRKRADAAMAARDYGVAVGDFTALLQAAPQDERVQFGLAMARLGSGDAAGAVRQFDALIAQRPAAAAHYGRALARRELGDRGAAIADVERALSLEPGNPRYAALRDQLAGASRPRR